MRSSADTYRHRRHAGAVTQNQFAATQSRFAAMHSQRGAVLVVSLIMLTVLTVLVITAAQTTSLEEKMAAAERDRNVSFQAAEIALRDAEAFIESQSSTANFNGSNGLYNLDNNDPDDDPPAREDLRDPTHATWSGSASRTLMNRTLPDAGAGGVSRQPRYIVTLVDVRRGGGALNISGYGQRASSGDINIFRITAMATGGAASTRTVLESHYGRVF